MLSRNKTYSLAENLYHEAKLQLEKQIFVPKQLKALTNTKPTNYAAIRI